MVFEVVFYIAIGSSLAVLAISQNDNQETYFILGI
jgi:hypothetical protein